MQSMDLLQSGSNRKVIKMSITIPMILDRLPNRVLENENFISNIKTDIHDVSILASPFSEYKENRLYVLQNSITVKDLNGILPVNLFYIHNGCCFYTGKFFETQSILLLEGINDPQELASEIRDIIFYYREMFDNLLSVVGDDAGLQNLTNVIAAYFRNPVAIFARGLKLLAHSQNYTMKEKLWLDTEEKGYLEVEGNMSHLLKEQSKISEWNKHPFIYFPQGMEYKIASKTIIKGNEEIGIFQVIEYNQPFTHGVLDIMEVMSVYLTIELNKKLIHFKNGILNGQLFIDLLEKKVDSLQTLKNRNNNPGWLLAKYLFVLAIKPTSRFLVDEQLSKISNHLNLLLPFGNCLVYDKGIVVIINKSADIPFNSETETQLLALLKEWNLCCGLSQCSTNMLDVARLYEQSLQAIKIGGMVHPGCFIYNYSQIALYDFFDNCLQNENISSYHHPAIAVLKDYDANHRNTLLNTLWNYISNHNNQMDTAKQMYISRSTLLYRIHKIEKLTNIDLNNPDTIFHLLLSFKLLEYEKHFSSPTDPYD